MVLQGEHQDIGIVHGSLMVHELIHEKEITRQEQEAAAAREAIAHSPDIRQEQVAQGATGATCFRLFSWFPYAR